MFFHNLLTLLSFQDKTFVHFQNTNGNIFDETCVFCSSFESPLHQIVMLQKVHKYIVKIWLNMIVLYDKQISFKL